MKTDFQAARGVHSTAPPHIGNIIAHSAIMLHLLDKAQRVARADVSVLIEGESGTGKELLARYIHEHSKRAGRPYVCINCAAISESLAESELFGHERGAFTGAEYARPGRFELAHGGTLLLDEIGEMSLNLQTKLLRVLEERTFERVGGCKTMDVDVRVIATTNRQLEHEVSSGKFRLDLLYRLNAIHLTIPSLRARVEDIMPIATAFLTQARNEDPCKDVIGFSAGATALLKAYRWPGNIRELRNVVQGAFILTTSRTIEAADLPLRPEAGVERLPAFAGTLAEMERRLILETLHESGGSQTQAAAKLGITTRTLQNKLKLYRSQRTAA